MRPKWFVGILIGLMLIYVGVFGLSGFAFRLTLAGDFLKEDFDTLSAWAVDDTQNAGLATINPAGQCSFSATGRCRYSHQTSDFPTQLTFEIRFKIDSWGSGAAGEFYVWLEDYSYVFGISVLSSKFRAVITGVYWVTCATDIGTWYTWRVTEDTVSANTTVYRDDGTGFVKLGSWANVYKPNGNSKRIESFNEYTDSGTVMSHIDYFYLDTGVKPPTSAPPPGNPVGNLHVVGTWDGVNIAYFSVHYHNGSFTSPDHNVILTTGFQWDGLKAGISYTVDGYYATQGKSASGSATVVADSMVNVILNFGSSSTITFTFTKYAGNPVMTPLASPSWENSVIGECDILYDYGVYKMWYRGSSGTSSALGYATSNDCITWTRYSGNPIMSSGYAYPTVIKVGSVYYLYEAKIGLEKNGIYRWSSANGISWSMDNGGSPVLSTGSVGSWDDRYICNTPVYYDASLSPPWRMIYEAKGYSTGVFKQGYATSFDGLTWTKWSTPVLPPADYHLDETCDASAVKKINGMYHIWYSGYVSGTGYIYHSSSSDMINWGSTEVSLRTGAGWEGSILSNPMIIDGPSGKLYMLYNGAQTMVGLAIQDGSTPPPAKATLTLITEYVVNSVPSRVSVAVSITKDGGVPFTWTTDSNGQHSEQVDPGFYAFSATYLTIPDSDSVNLAAGDVKTVTLSFVASTPPPNKATINLVTQYVVAGSPSGVSVSVTVTKAGASPTTWTTASDGTHSEQVDPGTYSFSATYNGLSDSESVTVVSGDARTVILTFTGSTPNPKDIIQQIIDFINNLLSNQTNRSVITYLGAGIAGISGIMLFVPESQHRVVYAPW